MCTISELHVTHSQFHQNFTSSFCADILSPQQSQTVIREKLQKITFVREKTCVKC